MLFLMRPDFILELTFVYFYAYNFLKALKDLLPKLGNYYWWVAALQFFYKSQFELHSYFILADGTLIKLSNILNILFKLMFVIYY